MKNEDLMKYSKENLVNAILDYEEQIISLKKERRLLNRKLQISEEYEKRLEKVYDFAYEILNEKGETFGY